MQNNIAPTCVFFVCKGCYCLQFILYYLFPFFKKMNSVTTSVKLGDAMINSVCKGSEKKHLENQDINTLANQ